MCTEAAEVAASETLCYNCYYLRFYLYCQFTKNKNHEPIKFVVWICTCVCYWWTQPPVLLAQVQSAAAASLEKAAVKVALLRPLGGRGWMETLHLHPQQFVNTMKDSGKHVLECCTAHCTLTTTTSKHVGAAMMHDIITKQQHHKDPFLIQPIPLTYEQRRSRAIVLELILKAHFTLMACVYYWGYLQLWCKSSSL